MADGILTDNDRKAVLSFAYLAALAAKAGYTCQRALSRTWTASTRRFDPATRCGRGSTYSSRRHCHRNGTKTG